MFGSLLLIALIKENRGRHFPPNNSNSFSNQLLRGRVSVTHRRRSSSPRASVTVCHEKSESIVFIDMQNRAARLQSFCLAEHVARIVS